MSNGEKLVLVEVRNVYGEDKIYPRNPQAKLFADIARTATLRPADIGRIKALGFEVVESYSTRLADVLAAYADGMPA